jgi:SEC-C motif domain protein
VVVVRRATACPCGRKGADGPLDYVRCCARFIEGDAVAPDAETLMRSRYTAYVLGREAYLLDTWHASTRPPSLQLANDAPAKWLGLDVLLHATDPRDPNRAEVEFIARYKIGGRALRLHELSRFVCEAGRWYYVDGLMR